MRTFNLTQPGAQLPQAHAVAFAPRQITPADARIFIQYQHVDKITEALADYLKIEIDDIERCWADPDGDILYRHAGKTIMLREQNLTELALSMGWRDWVQPNYSPLPPMR